MIKSQITFKLWLIWLLCRMNIFCIDEYFTLPASISRCAAHNTTFGCTLKLLYKTIPKMQEKKQLLLFHPHYIMLEYFLCTQGKQVNVCKKNKINIWVWRVKALWCHSALENHLLLLHCNKGWTSEINLQTDLSSLMWRLNIISHFNIMFK